MTTFSGLAQGLLSLSLDCSPPRSFSSKDWTAVDNGTFVVVSSALFTQPHTFLIKDTASQQQNNKLKRATNERQIQLIILLCLPVFLSSSNSATHVTMSISRIAETRPESPIYRSRVTECRYPAIPDVSIVWAAMSASTGLSMTGKSAMALIAPPLMPLPNSGRVLRLLKDEQRVFQQNPPVHPIPREEFSSSLKNCMNPRGFRWAAVI